MKHADRVLTETVAHDHHAAGTREGEAAPEKQNRAPLAFPGRVVGRMIGFRKRHPWSLLSLTRLQLNLYTKRKFSRGSAARGVSQSVRSTRMSTASRKEQRPERQAAPTGALKALLDECQRYMLPRDLDLVQHAYALAEEAHRGVKRQSGEPYIEHPLAVAKILADMRIDAQGIAAALLHDVVEDTRFTL